MNLHLLRIGKRPQKHPDGHFNHSNWTVSILKFTFKSKKQTTLSFVKTLRLYFDRKCFASCNFSFFKQHTKKQRKHPRKFFPKNSPRKNGGVGLEDDPVPPCGMAYQPPPPPPPPPPPSTHHGSWGSLPRSTPLVLRPLRVPRPRPHPWRCRAPLCPPQLHPHLGSRAGFNRCNAVMKKMPLEKIGGGGGCCCCCCCWWWWWWWWCCFWSDVWKKMGVYVYVTVHTV